MLSSFQRGDCLSGIVTHFGPAVIRLFRLATAPESSESRKTHTLRLFPVPNAYAPAMPFRARARRCRRLIDKNCAATSADTNGSGVMGFLSFRDRHSSSQVSLSVTRKISINGFSSALVIFKSRCSQTGSSGACCPGTLVVTWERSCNLVSLAGMAC